MKNNAKHNNPMENDCQESSRERCAREEDIIEDGTREETAEDSVVTENKNGGFPDIQEGAGKENCEKQARQELEETQERLLRLHADFDNYRKRVNKEKEEWYQYASLGIIEKLLPVLDNFELALTNLEGQKEEIKGIFSGIAMIYRQLCETLQKEGLEHIPALGEAFDPLVHEAVMRVDTEDREQDNRIVEELRKGYRFRDKLIRPSMVKVAKIKDGSKEE